MQKRRRASDNREEAHEQFQIASFCTCQIHDRTRREEEAKHRTNTVKSWATRNSLSVWRIAVSISGRSFPTAARSRTPRSVLGGGSRRIGAVAVAPNPSRGEQFLSCPDPGRVASAEVARDGYVPRIVDSRELSAVVAPTQICHRPEDLARPSHGDGQRRSSVCIGRLNGKLTGRVGILRAGDLHRIGHRRYRDRPDHPTTAAMRRAVVREGPLCSEGVAKNKSAIVKTRIHNPSGFPGVPEVELWPLAAQIHSTVSPT